VTAGLRLLSGPESGAAGGFHGMIGAHPTMLRLFDAIRRAAPLELPVIVQGPTGVGKELVAQALHVMSGRRGPIVPINVGTVPEQLAESELFGSVRGAYTGAVSERMGLVESARDGTLFLDEATELSPTTQIRLLRVVESGIVRPVGGTAGRQVDFRLILCVQQPAADLVATKRWREDFYYRVAGVSLTVPALQERASDVGLLANHWLLRLGHPPLAARDAEQLAARRWPGNVRELRRAIERAALLAGMEAVTIDGIVEAADSLSLRPSPGRETGAGASLAAIEREHIERVLRECGYQTRAAARLLGLSAGQLYRKYRALGIAPPRSR
jgi:DNA-binding NtrC family response regulator